MSQALSVQAEVCALNEKYKEYIGELRRAWQAENWMYSRNVLEVMDADERREVDKRIAQWKRHITPFAEAWWKERGFGVIWPGDDSEPMKVYKLDAA